MRMTRGELSGLWRGLYCGDSGEQRIRGTSYDGVGQNAIEADRGWQFFVRRVRCGPHADVTGPGDSPNNLFFMSMISIIIIIIIVIIIIYIPLFKSPIPVRSVDLLGAMADGRLMLDFMEHG